MAAGELAKRVSVAAVGIPLAVGLIYLGGWAMGLVLALLAAIGATEVYSLAERLGTRPYRPMGAALAAALVTFGVAHRSFASASPYLWGAVITAAIIAAIAGLRLRGVAGKPLGASAVTLFGAIYVGGGFSFAVFLRNLDPAPGASWLGAALVAYPLAVTWVGDTLAYFGGLRWGRRKLAPNVSPNKTVEGAIAGFTGSVAAGALFGWLVFGVWLGQGITAPLAAVGAAAIAIAGQIGDLAESLLKREAGVKDSGRLLPGHGGVLDRFDALIPAIPVAFAYLTLIVPHFAEVPWR